MTRIDAGGPRAFDQLQSREASKHPAVAADRTQDARSLPGKASSDALELTAGAQSLARPRSRAADFVQLQTGCGADQSCAGPGGVEATTDFDAEPGAHFDLRVRRFAPFHSFGGGFHGDAATRGLPKGGDGRGGFTTDDKATSRVEGRVVVRGENIQTTARSDETSHWLLGKDTAVPDVNDDSSATSAKDGRIQAKVAGAMPLTWANGHMVIPAAPDINASIDATYEMNGETLRISGEVRGDTFPNGELLLTDPRGNTVSISQFQTDHGKNEGPLLHLFDNDHRLMHFDVTIDVDANGNFLSSPLTTPGGQR